MLDLGFFGGFHLLTQIMSLNEVTKVGVILLLAGLCNSRSDLFTRLYKHSAHSMRSVLSHSPHRLISIHAIGRFCHILDAAAPLFFPACVFSFLVRLVEKVFGKVLQRPIILVEAARHGQHPLSPSGSFGTPGGVFLAEG